MHHEIIDLTDPNNDSFIFITPPMFDDKPVGGLLRNKPVVCGYGKGEDGCFIFDQPMRRTLPRPLGFGAYSESQNMVIPSRNSMLEKRNHASSVVLNDTTLWVVGMLYIKCQKQQFLVTSILVKNYHKMIYFFIDF